MELRQLRQFLAVADTLSFRRAAAMLNMAQPPLSVAIRKLEDELGVQLFLRGARGVELTVAGSAILSGAREMLKQAEDLRRLAAGIGEGTTGQLRVGFVGSALQDLLPPLVRAFRQRFPDVDLTLRESSSEAMLDDLDDARLDVALIRTPLLRARAVAITPMQEDRLSLALPSDHPILGRRGWSLGNLSAEPFLIYPPDSALHAAVMLACADAGFIPQIAQHAAQVQTVLSLVAAGVGVALVPRLATRDPKPGVAFVPLQDSPKIGLGLATRQIGVPLPARHFIALSSEMFQVSQIA